MTHLGWFLTTCLAIEAVTVGMLVPKPTLLLWNASPSAPLGLYAVRPQPTPKIGELVAIRPPTTLARFMAGRHYLPLGLPLLKHIAALPGQAVCRLGPHLSIEGRSDGTALKWDRRGRSLPVWSGCRVIRPGEVFLLNAAPDSLDSRYFGPLPASGIVGRAVPLWTRERP